MGDKGSEKEMEEKKLMVDEMVDHILDASE